MYTEGRMTVAGSTTGCSKASGAKLIPRGFGQTSADD